MDATAFTGIVQNRCPDVQVPSAAHPPEERVIFVIGANREPIFRSWYFDGVSRTEGSD